MGAFNSEFRIQDMVFGYNGQQSEYKGQKKILYWDLGINIFHKTLGH
jgi:hypothetical protein